jgi:hypothetical protein
MTLEEASRRYERQLEQLGFKTETEQEDGVCDISFVRGDEIFYLEVQDDDVAIARLSLSYELDENQKNDPAQLLEVANTTSSESKGVLVIIDEDNDVEFRHDAFVNADLDLGPSLPRILDALEETQQRFFDAL